MYRAISIAGSFLLFTSAAIGAEDFPPGPDQALVQETCTACHLATEVTSQHKTADQWADTVNQMIMNGAKVSDSDYDKIVNYLARNFGPAGTPKADSN